MPLDLVSADDDVTPQDAVDVLAESDLDFWLSELPFLLRARYRFLAAGGGSAVAALTRQIHTGRIEYLKALESMPDVDGEDDEVITEIAQDMSEWTPDQRRKLIRLLSSQDA